MAEERKYKICEFCVHYMKETLEVEGECLQEEDINSTAYCEYFERKK
jgi:hypothetical protein